jgi:hypothetical protein
MATDLREILMVFGDGRVEVSFTVLPDLQELPVREMMVPDFIA